MGQGRLLLEFLNQFHKDSYYIQLIAVVTLLKYAREPADAQILKVIYAGSM